jgi:hypothetical protein
VCVKAYEGVFRGAHTYAPSYKGKIIATSKSIDRLRSMLSKQRKDSAGSCDTASMPSSVIKGGSYLGARTRQPPTAQTI